jgi:hypothetical protein
MFMPVETTADKLRVGDTVKIGNSWRVIAKIARVRIARLTALKITDDLDQVHPFYHGQKVSTQLLQLL